MVRITIPLIVASLAFTVTPSLAAPVFEDGHQSREFGKGATTQNRPSQEEKLHGLGTNYLPTINRRSLALMAGSALIAYGEHAKKQKEQVQKEQVQKEQVQKEPISNPIERRDFESVGDTAATPVPSDRTNQSLPPTLQVAVNMVIKVMRVFRVGTYSSSETSNDETNQSLSPTFQVALYMARKVFFHRHDISYVVAQRPDIDSDREHAKHDVGKVPDA